MENILASIFHAVTGTLFAASFLSLPSVIPTSTTPSNQIPAPIEYRVNTTPQYSLINPLIFIDTDQRLFTEYDSFDQQMVAYTKDSQNKNKVTSISVYFRDINSGHWTGTNENELYEPGSMLKVVTLIAYLRYAMDQSTLTKTTAADVLSQQIFYPGADETGEYYKSTRPSLSPGMYSIQRLLEHMMIDSDNTALNVLMANQSAMFQNVYNDFRLPPTPTGQDGDFMTAKSFSVVFRSLFNASYLLRSSSEQALELLTKTTFNDGLVAGVASSTSSAIKIAHKFGERTYQLPNGTIQSRELHDCGIIYYPGHPYFLCVMTKGQDFPTLAHVIADISKITYTFVGQRNNMK
jgi:hypothetical protein